MARLLHVVLLFISLCAAFDLGVGWNHGRFLGEQFEIADTLARDDSKGLQEFTPILNVIVQSQTQYYSFNVNSSTGLGEYYEYLVFLTGNICSQDSNTAASANKSLTVYYSFNSSMFQNLELGQMGHFESGYFQALTDVAIQEGGQSVLYIAVRAPESTNVTATWSYEIGVSQNDLVFQYDDRSFVEVVDTDHESALIKTGNLTYREDKNASTYNVSQSIYLLYVYSYEHKDLFQDLNCSWCAIRNGPALFATTNFVTSYTTRGGGLHQEFFVSGLNASTQYVAYLVSNFGGANFGGSVYKQFAFETMSSDACALIYDLEFCDQVAYSVPALSLEEYSSKNDLKQLYDDRAKALYGNFSKAMQQIACNTTNDAIFSPIRTCDNCKLLYKNWLCSVTIPRCSTRNISGYIYREANESRNSFIDEDVVPPLSYFEVLPCVNVCQSVVRDCPAKFGFVCPTRNYSISLSYYWDTGSEYASCNFVGIHPAVSSGAVTLQIATWMAFLACVVSTMFV